MTKRLLFFVICTGSIITNGLGQTDNFLPRYMTEQEKLMMEDYLQSFNDRGITSPPPFTSLRTAAEWEEVQALVITWTGQYNTIHRQIIAAAQEECQVLIMSDDSNAVKTNLNTYGIPLTNLTFLQVDFNSVWIRDYGANSVYVNDVDSLILVDWIYNRPRPDDDVMPDYYAAELGVPIYSMTANPYRMMTTGGNWMSDGSGQAFSSELLLDENDGSGPYALSYPNHTESEIDDLFNQWMGIETYIKMTVLPYDDIHHIDMHMKIIDEQTLLVGEYPAGIADGPQIEANLQYVLDNYMTKFGTPYDVVRIPQPPNTSGNYPDAGASYRTYANQTFVNNTILLPVYRQEYDTIALNILGNTMPGYTIVPIDVDNSGMNLIGAGGAIHCITHTVGVSDPLLISHQKLEDTYDDLNPYQATADIKHKSGIANATLYYKTSIGGSYLPVAMTNTAGTTWSGLIPAQAAGTTVYYYIEGDANNSRVATHPVPAPDGYHKFTVLDGGSADMAEQNPVRLDAIYPNPASAITVIPVEFSQPVNCRILVMNMLGEIIAVVYEGQVEQGPKNFFIDAGIYSSGVYHVVVECGEYKRYQKLIVH
jgi:agmatine deiminase